MPLFTLTPQAFANQVLARKPAAEITTSASIALPLLKLATSESSE